MKTVGGKEGSVETLETSGFPLSFVLELPNERGGDRRKERGVCFSRELKASETRDKAGSSNGGKERRHLRVRLRNGI
jgi:hypothetical protein